MLGTAIIVFREVLEAALIISIVLAATRALPGSRPWAALGVAGGLFGSLAAVMGAERIIAAADGMGQELMNAAILLAAAAMLAWHAIWMASHGRDLAKQANDLSLQVSNGSRSLFAIAIVIGAAVLREGSETVLFLFGIAAGEEQAMTPMLAGGLMGLAAGIAAGIALYQGLLRIPVRHLFSVTNTMVLVLAAGMASQCAGFLVQAGYLPPLASPLWDTAWLLSEKSVTGKLLHTLAGYVSRPDGVQVLSFATTLLVALVLMRLAGRGEDGPARTSRTTAMVAATLTLAIAGVALPRAAQAEFKMRYPNIDYREVEIEHNYSTTFDRRAENNRRATSPVEVGVGILPFWFVELEGEFNKDPGERWSFDATTFESYLMLTEPGKYWLDFTLFTEYSRSQNRGEPDTVKIGTLFQKERCSSCIR